MYPCYLFHLERFYFPKNLYSQHTYPEQRLGWHHLQVDMAHIKKTIDSGRVCYSHVLKLMRGPVLWETSDASAVRLTLFLLGHNYSDLFTWCWKSNCKWMKSKAHLKAKSNNKMFPTHAYPPSEDHSDNSNSSCTRFSSPWDQKTPCAESW